MIDRTKSKMGKARPWMFYGFFGCAITLYGVFAIPTNMGKTAQYAWFFICYTLLNAVFYTANNIAYAALTSLVTKNSKERVQMGSFRFMFSFATNLAIQSITVGAVGASRQRCSSMENHCTHLLCDRYHYQYTCCIFR